MKKEEISEILGGIGESHIAEAAAYRVRKKPADHWIKWGSLAACLCLLTAVFLIVPRVSEHGEKSGEEDTEASGKITDVNAPSESVPDGEYSGDSGYVTLPENLSDIPVYTEGKRDAFTAEEGKAYLESARSGLESTLRTCGVRAEGCRIGGGYTHVGIDGNTAVIRENFRDYLLFTGEKLAAIVIVSKENGVFHESLVFGAPWFDDYRKMLEKHRGEELLYLYLGNTEVVVTPDGTVLSTAGIELPEDYTGRGKELYGYFRCGNTFIPQ